MSFFASALAHSTSYRGAWDRQAVQVLESAIAGEVRMSTTDMTDTEQLGVQMLIALQGLAGIEETEERALRGWRAMQDWQRECTSEAYVALCQK